MKPLLAQSGPLDDIDVALRLIYALGKWINGFMPTSFLSVLSVPEEQDNIPGFADDTPGFCQQREQYHPQCDPLWCAESMKFADFAAWSEVRFSAMVKTAMTLAVTAILKELTP